MSRPNATQSRISANEIYMAGGNTADYQAPAEQIVNVQEGKLTGSIVLELSPKAKRAQLETEKRPAPINKLAPTQKPRPVFARGPQMRNVNAFQRLKDDHAKLALARAPKPVAPVVVAKPVQLPQNIVRPVTVLNVAPSASHKPNHAGLRLVALNNAPKPQAQKLPESAPQRSAFSKRYQQLIGNMACAL